MIIASGAAQAAKLFVTTVNAGLQFWTAFYASSHGIKVSLVHINTLLYQLVSNPSTFGFTNSTGAAYNPNIAQSFSPPLNPVADPDDYVFWDGFHPTTNAHRFAAGLIFISVVSSRAFPGSTQAGHIRIYGPLEGLQRKREAKNAGIEAVTPPSLRRGRFTVPDKMIVSLRTA